MSKAVTRAIRILRALERARRPMSVEDLATELELGAWPVRRSLAALVQAKAATMKTERTTAAGSPRQVFLAVRAPK